uniref:Large ribosomal subunit protein uL22c n=1 Tax=Kuetzingia canaliculata TaxID=228262 RepID=A0A1Z1MP97_KUECA|nr:ribosomal protein L22 [Kuetzingia canaliculata]ARW67917.1 ribosomal protein L22 [Kuetzingia canaliculata]
MKEYKLKAHAITKYIRISDYKSRRVLKQIQGKSYQEARIILEFMPYKASKIIIKILESALNNILQKTTKTLEKKDIVIIEAFANKGPILKRFQPRAQGRAFSIHKPTCHIKITLAIK